ncbi:MAG: FtsQ-type POTRA domain-containing protein [Gammaproteobacteria bacterium]|nr:FtsQ-type POTRA domain-containing protein [Gammaproteobacteria bacterium]
MAKKKTRKTPQKEGPSRQVIGRWLLGLSLLGLLCGGGVWGVLWLKDPGVLPFRVVGINGQLRYMKRSDVEQALAEATKGNFFTVDVKSVQQETMKLPWVDQVSVRRVWPDTLQMWVQEKTPLARWGESKLVSTRGVSFEPPSRDIPADLPRLYGPDGTEQKVAAGYLEMQRRLGGLGLVISSMRLDARHAWWVQIQNGLELHLGNRDTDRRLKRFIRVYPQLRQEEGGRLISVDLRYTNGFAAQRRKEAT